MKQIMTGMLLIVSVMLYFPSLVWAGAEWDNYVAEEAFKKGNYDQAIGIFTKVIESRDASGYDKQVAYYYRAICWQKKGNNDRALADLIATGMNPIPVGGGELAAGGELSCSVLLARGKIYFLKGDYDKAYEDVNACWSCPHKGEDYGLLLGLIQYKRGHYDNAIYNISRAIRKDVTAEIFYNRGCVWATKGVYYKAIADFDMALRINPNFSQAITARNKALDLQRKTTTGR
jgi:tetratricopeptide (TPR) repeat protein